MTYGTLPNRELFDTAFNETCPDGTFEISNDKELGTVKLDCEQTWELIERGIAELDKHGIGCHTTDLAGAVLYMLGIEWV